FEMLLNARGDANYQVHLTYPIDEIDTERRNDWEKQRNKEIQRKKKNPHNRVREKWSPEKHGLRAFFEKNPEFATKLRVSDIEQAHIIDLADPMYASWPTLVS